MFKLIEHTLRGIALSHNFSMDEVQWLDVVLEEGIVKIYFEIDSNFLRNKRTKSGTMKAMFVALPLEVIFDNTVESAYTYMEKQKEETKEGLKKNKKNNKVEKRVIH